MNKSQKFLINNHYADLAIGKDGKKFIYVSDVLEKIVVTHFFWNGMKMNKPLIFLAVYVSLLCVWIWFKFDQTQNQIEILRQDSVCQFHDLSNQIACLHGNCDSWEISDNEDVNECRELFKEKLE